MLPVHEPGKAWSRVHRAGEVKTTSKENHQAMNDGDAAKCGYGRIGAPDSRRVITRFFISAFPALFFLACIGFPGAASPQSSRTTMPGDTLQQVVAPFPVPAFTRPAIPERQFDIRDFGARESTDTKSTQAIRRAIETAARAGGGTVVIPDGVWRSGAIHLEDNINLHLSAGAELRFSQDFEDYLPVVFSRHEDIECYKSSAFISANGKSNIAITGTGILDGQGTPWWPLKEQGAQAEVLLYDMASRGVPVEQRVFDGSAGKQLRPAFFQPVNCRNVLVEGPTFLYGAFWTITPTYCENVIIRKIRIVTEGERGHVPNGDGIDPSSCKNVLIEKCTFDTGDDCIAIKAGRDKDGRRVGVPTENVVIRDCTGLRGHGGIVIGSETAGGIRNVLATDCRFTGTDRIIRIKTARGRGGTIENLWFRNIEGRDIAREAIHVNMLYTGERLPAAPVSEETPRIRNLHFENVSCASGKGYGIEILGLPEMPVENVFFTRLDLRTSKGVNLADVNSVHFKESRVSATAAPLIAILDGRDITFGAGTLTVSGGVILSVRGQSSAGINISRRVVPAGKEWLSLDVGIPPGAVVVTE